MMFRIEIGSSLWNCAYARTSNSRITAFRKVCADVAKIPDPSLRPSEAELTAAYTSLASWDRRTRSPRMSHEPGDRRWYLNIERA